MTPVPRLLVVDNSTVVVQWVESALAGAYSVTGATQGANVAAIASRLGPAAILLAPDSPALAAGCEALRRAAPGARILLFADLPAEQLADERARTGADGCLRRVGDADAFSAALDALLGRGTPGPLARQPTASVLAEVATGLAVSRRTIVIAQGGAGLAGESILARREFLVRRAGTGAQASALLRTGTACLLVVGPSLEDTRVDELVARIRADPALRRTSILFVGEAGDAPAAAAATGAGANVALLRPFDERELVDAVARLANVAPRRATRLLVRLRVGVQTDDFRVGFTRNVSSSGMLLEADSGLAVGSLLGLRFFVPGKAEEVSADGQVVRLHDLTAVRSVVGVHFVTIGGDDRTSIRAFVATKAVTG